MANLSEYVKNLIRVTTSEQAMYSGVKEGNEKLCSQIKNYWTSLGFEFVSCTSDDYPWSAVFISYCIKTAGATSAEFLFSPKHAVYVKKAIKNADEGTGVFRAVPVDSYAPKIGDIIQSNRNGGEVTYNQARNDGSYNSHCAIVVELGRNLFGHFAVTIGGNEKDSIRRDKVRLDSNGFIKQQKRNPYISIIKNLK